MDAQGPVVLIYQGKYRSSAQRVAECLKARGTTAWLSDPDSGRTRNERGEEFLTELEGASACVFLAPSPRISRHQQREIDLLCERLKVDSQLPSATLLVDGSRLPEDLPELLASRPKYDVRGCAEDKVADLVQHLARNEPIRGYECSGGALGAVSVAPATTGVPRHAFEPGGAGERSEPLDTTLATPAASSGKGGDAEEEENPQGALVDKPRKYRDDRDRDLRWLLQWFAPLPNRPARRGSPGRDELEKNVPPISDPAIAADLLEEAKAVMAMRDHRITSAESKATTLVGTVAIAASLVVAGSGLILDPNRVTKGWREALIVLVGAVLLFLLMTGYLASRALFHVRTLKRPQVRHAWQRAGLRDTAASRRALAIDMMARAGENRYVADYKLAQIQIAYRWYQLALVGFLMFGLAIAAYVLFGEEPT
jgi:hypothetical protein